MFDFAGYFFSCKIKGLCSGLTVCCKSLILLEIFFSNEINGLAGSVQVMDEVLMISMT